MSLGDVITYICLLIALWYVPRYLLKVYAPGLYARIQMSLRDAIAAAQARDYARYQEKLARKSVNHSQNVMSHAPAQTKADAQTDKQTDHVSAADQWMDRVEVDRTKTALIELLVYSGWDVAQIRGVLKGDNGALGVEIEAARKKLGVAPEAPRMIYVRDNGQPARAIPISDPDHPFEPLRA